jgi:hypothetical protein
MPDFTALLGLKDTWGNSSDAGDNDGDTLRGSPVPGGSGQEHDFFGGEDFDSYAGPSMGWGAGGGDDDDGDVFGAGGTGANTPGFSLTVPHASAGGYAGLGMGQPGEHLAPFDPRAASQQGQGSEQQHQLVMALALASDEDAMGKGGMMDMFDKTINGQKGWAGWGHWKLRKVTKKGMSIGNIECGLW